MRVPVPDGTATTPPGDPATQSERGRAVASSRGRSSVFADDSGQLMMLAGIVLTISFILTALTLSQVASLEREAAAQAPLPVINEWRFLHERLASNLNTAVGPETTIDSFQTIVLPTVQATFRSVESEKGYDLIIRLADDETYAVAGNEADLIDVVTGRYDAWSWSGKTHFTHLATDEIDEDPDHNDGILWQDDTCPEPAAPAAGCIGGVYLHVRLTDGTVTLSESILFATNRP